MDALIYNTQTLNTSSLLAPALGHSGLNASVRRARRPPLNWHPAHGALNDAIAGWHFILKFFQHRFILYSLTYDHITYLHIQLSLKRTLHYWTESRCHLRRGLIHLIGAVRRCATRQIQRLKALIGDIKYRRLNDGALACGAQRITCCDLLHAGRHPRFPVHLLPGSAPLMLSEEDSLSGALRTRPGHGFLHSWLRADILNWDGSPGKSFVWRYNSLILTGKYFDHRNMCDAWSVYPRLVLSQLLADSRSGDFDVKINAKANRSDKETLR